MQVMLVSVIAVALFTQWGELDDINDILVICSGD